MDLKDVMEEEAQKLLFHFNHRNLDALLKMTRNTLEMLRKHFYTSSTNFIGLFCLKQSKKMKMTLSDYKVFLLICPDHQFLIFTKVALLKVSFVHTVTECKT